MTVRGIYSTIIFNPESYTPPVAPLAIYQNYSPTAIPSAIGASTYNAEYRPFAVSAIASDSNSLVNDFDVTFAATGAITDFLDTAILGRYEVIVFTDILAANIDTPAYGTDLYLAAIGNIIEADVDFSTITIKVGQYENGVNSDLPWRRIPWTILGPLSIRN
jgi:hypothetical protein